MSNLKLKVTPQSFEAAKSALGDKSRRTIGHNTELIHNADGIYALYHGNKIVRYTEDGVYASWAGWTSTTTATRLNMLAPARFNIKNFTSQINGQDVDSSGWHKVA
jgi:hypothetical protein